MKKLFVATILLSALAGTATAQKKLYLTQNPIWVEWADSIKIHPVPPEHASQPALIMLNEVKIDYRVEGKDIVKHTTRHGIIKVFDDNGIARYSVLRFPLSKGAKVPTIKARSICPSGTVWNFNYEKLRYGFEDGKYTLYVPIEGLDENSEIEYLVKEVSANDHFGTEEFQFDVPVSKTRFMLSFRKDMVVEGKSFNGFPDLKYTQEKTRNVYKVEIDDIPALLPEKLSYYDRYKMQFNYRVSYYTPNEGLEKIKLNTYDNLARKIYDDNFNISEKERKAVNGFLHELGVHAHDDDEINIRKIELGIKKNITLYPYVDYIEHRENTGVTKQRSMSVYAAGYEDPREVLDTVLSKKAATYKGYIRLFAACLSQLGIRHEIGRAWDRSEYQNYTSFESWQGLNHTLIYFPKQKKFLAPTEVFLRYPVVPSELAGSKGVFCAMPNKGELTGPMHKVRRITPLAATESRNDISASVVFNKNMDAKANISHAWYGYPSVDIRTHLPFVRPENMQKYVAEMFDFVDNPADVTNYTFSNDDVNNYNTNKPLTLTATVDASGIVNKAGSRYLIKAGALINNQLDDYENNPRLTSVDLEYPHSNTHTITINIPKGYKIVNPEAARISADYLNGDVETVISFYSDYKLVKDSRNGDKLVITVNEMYKQVHFSLLEYQRFRKVWNAAADFNNVTLVMVRK